MTLNKAVRELRRAYRHSQRVFAEQLGLSTQTIASYEGGNRIPDRRSLIRLAIAARAAGQKALEAEFSKALAGSAYSNLALATSIRGEIGKLLALDNGDEWLASELLKLILRARKAKDRKLQYFELLLTELNQITGVKPIVQSNVVVDIMEALKKSISASKATKDSVRQIPKSEEYRPSPMVTFDEEE